MDTNKNKPVGPKVPMNRRVRLKRTWNPEDKAKYVDPKFQECLRRANTYLRELKEPEIDSSNHCAGRHGLENPEVVIALRAYENESVKQRSDLYKQIWAIMLFMFTLNTTFSQMLGVMWGIVVAVIAAALAGILFIYLIVYPKVIEPAQVQAVVDAVWKHRDK